jgi:hypothetical protein
MAQVNDQNALIGNFRQRYADKILALYKFLSPLCTEYFPFESAKAIGDKYNQPADLQMEAGISHSAGGVTPQATGLTGFISPIAGQMQNAQAVGGQIFGRAQVAYEAQYRSKGTEKAFVESVGWIVKRLSMAHMKRMEIFMLHGGMGLGVVNNNVAAVGLTKDFPLTVQSSSPGLWNGLLGSRIVMWNSGLTALQSVAGNGTVTASVSKLTFNTATYQVTVTLTYNVANADTATDFTGSNLFFETGGPGAEMNGIDGWASVTTATASWYNIPPPQFDLWCANQVPVNGALRFADIVAACGIAQNFGILSGPLCCTINPKIFANVMTEQAALRRYGAERVDSEFQNGSKKLVFNTGAGECEILAHPIQKLGLAHIFCPAEGKRIGATDVTFITRGAGGEQLILESATAPASEMRSYSLTESFFEQPRHLVQLTGITG